MIGTDYKESCERTRCPYVQLCRRDGNEENYHKDKRKKKYSLKEKMESLVLPPPGKKIYAKRIT